MNTFTELAEHYLAGRNVSPAYGRHVRAIAARAGTIGSDKLNRYLARRLEQVSGITARNERTILLSVWCHAYHSGRVEEAPRGIGKLRARRKPTKAWTVPQLKTLVDATRKHDGRRLRTGADRGAFLRAWVLLGYECGARMGDLFGFRREHIDGDSLAWTQAKTGEPLTRVLTPACLDAIDAMLAKSPDGTILGWACGKRQACRLMRELLDELGIGGTSKWLRRSGATHCEMEQAGSGRLHLGHRSPALFEQAYCDWSQLRTKTPRTPALV
jgi:integrase